MVASNGAPFVVNPDPNWRRTMSESAAFLIVTALLIFLLAQHGFRALMSARQEAERAKIELIHRLAVVAEWKDDKIGGHNLRIARTAHILAAKLGLSERERSLIYHGAVLHDIGKVGMPDYLLRKNGRFTSQERSLMERHVVLGATLLDGSDDELLRVARSIALTHHENWDGSGYPNGLVGEQIPIEGRIVALCDVLDALLSRRPYKEAWDGDEAIRYIVEQRGQKFEPRVVDAMLDSLPQLVAARNEAGHPWISPRVTSRDIYGDPMGSGRR
jgi:putative two-component system response regulator